jgi:hypothetical protein
MRMLAALLLCASAGTAGAAPHEIPARDAGTYALAGRCSAPAAPKLILAGDRVDVLQGTRRRTLYVESFCALNCDIAPPTDPRKEYSASLVDRPAARGSVKDPFDDTALTINREGSPGVVSLANDAPGTYQDRSRSALRHLYGKPFTRCSR